MTEPSRWHEHITLEPKLAFDVDDVVMARFTLGDDRLFASFAISPPKQRLIVLRVDAGLSGYTAGQARTLTAVHGQHDVTVEEIARWVEGDKTDPQRVALADGIRQGLPFARKR